MEFLCIFQLHIDVSHCFIKNLCLGCPLAHISIVTMVKKCQTCYLRPKGLFSHHNDPLSIFSWGQVGRLRSWPPPKLRYFITPDLFSISCTVSCMIKLRILPHGFLQKTDSLDCSRKMITFDAESNCAMTIHCPVRKLPFKSLGRVVGVDAGVSLNPAIFIGV